MEQQEYQQHEARQMSAYRARQERSRKARRIAWDRHVPAMTPNDKLGLAQNLINDVLDDGISYADFQSAQAVERYTRKARNALRGLSLS